MTRVLFVCLGNICRSPAAEGILRALAQKIGMGDQLTVASCGMGDWHLGQLPDPRMRQAALLRGYTLTSKAKPFIHSYLDEFDYILAADLEVLEFLHGYAHSPEHKAKLHLITAFSKAHRNLPVPDPYYQGPAAFDQIIDMLEDACQGLLNKIRST